MVTNETPIITPTSNVNAAFTIASLVQLSIFFIPNLNILRSYTLNRVYLIDTR